MKKSITLRVSEELRRRIDVARGEVPRERWIRYAIEMRLSHKQPEKEAKR